MLERSESVNVAPWKQVSPIYSGGETPETWQQDQDQSKTQVGDLRQQWDMCVTGKELKKKDGVLSEAAKPSLAAGIFDGGNQ